MNKLKITDVKATEILDSRGNPTLRTTVTLSDGSRGSASVPSGASTGSYEAKELRDGDRERYFGKGVLGAVKNVNTTLKLLLTSLPSADIFGADRAMIKCDGTSDKSLLGANALLSVSLALARALAVSLGVPLWSYLGGAVRRSTPVPMMNILNGGAHASNNIDIQEFMIVPVGAESFTEAMRAGSEIYRALGSILKSRGMSVAVGDEGGFAPDLSSDEEAVELICEAIIKAGYTTDRVKIALDAAAGEWRSEEGYLLPKRGRRMSYEELVEYYSSIAAKYPIISLEDGLGEDDTEGWRYMTEKLGDKLMLVGDDLFVTNTERFESISALGAANAILIKPNQIGTLTETLEVIELAKKKGYRPVISHRSGETADTFIADLAVAVSAPFIKSGAPCRGERTEKYNRLIEITEEMN